LLATRPHAGGAGRCLYRPLVGISERDHRYDDYLNSQECLINEEAAVFLRNYKLLMRADMGKRETSNRIRICICCHQCCGSGMFIPDPGSRIRIFSIPDPNFSIPDPGPRVDKIPDPDQDLHQRSIFNPKN
jgi:hypothetical protein